MSKSNLPKVATREIKLLFKKHGIGAWLELQKKYGSNYMHRGIWICSDPDLINTLLMQKVHTKSRSKLYKEKQLFIPIAKGLLFMDGEDWQKRLTAVMPSFTKAEVDLYANFMLSVLREELSAWRDEKTIPDFYRGMVDLNKIHLFKVGFGIELENEVAAQLGNQLIRYKFFCMDMRQRIDFFGVGLADIPQFIRTLRSQKERKKRERDIHNLYKRLAEMEGAASGEGKGLQWYARLKQANFSSEEVAQELNHLYGAYNALDFMLACCFLELIRNPEWQIKLREEWKEKMGKADGFSREVYSKLQWMHNFMKEVLRRYPVSMGVSRKSGEAIQVGDTLLEANQEILIALYPTHHHPDYWDNPEEFKPERWQAEPKHEFAYIPFLKGSRHCIGRHLAELNFILVLGSLLEQFEFSSSKPLPQYTHTMMPRFDRPFEVQLKRV